MLLRLVKFITVSALLLIATPVNAVDPVDPPPSASDVLKRNLFRIMPGARFRDCEKCPEMVVIPAGRFQMGSPEGERGRSSDESPMREVSIHSPFSIGRFEVSVAEWEHCVAARACREVADDRRGGGADRPVANVSWHDARKYTLWLSTVTSEQYRLPSEAEWEYAARAGNSAPRYWDENEVACAFGNVYDISAQRVHQFDWPHFTCIDATATTAPVGTYLANEFGLHDMLGNVWEWVYDCWNDGYKGAPSDSRPQLTGDCKRRVVRGGSWKSITWATRSAFRGWQGVNDRVDANGFRVARFGK